MDNQELLQAIGQMMDEKLAEQENRTDEKFRRLEENINGVKMKLDRDLEEIKSLLKEDYGRVEKNAAKGADAADRQKEMESTQADHTRALEQHNKRITTLEDAAI